MDKLTIIGINRFIGYHLTNFYLEQGVEVDGVILEQINDNFQLKINSFIRNANFQFINETEIDPTFPIIVDAYLFEDSIKLRQILDKIHGNDYMILSGEVKNLSENKVILLENVFGEWDEIINEELIRENSYVYVKDVCLYIGKKMENQLVELRDYLQTDFSKAIKNREDWKKRHKK